MQGTMTEPAKSRIIKATDAIPVEHPLFLIVGQPGICKTSLAYSAKNPLLLDFDAGAHRAVNRRDTWPITTWSDVVDLMENPEILEPYSTVVVDTVGRCIDVITADIAITDPKKAPQGNLSQQGWGVLKTRFRQWMTQLRARGKDVVLVSHSKEDKDGDITMYRPDIAGGSLGEVLKIADFVGFIWMNGKNRMLDFNPTDRWMGKNPAGWKPFPVPPVAKATDFLAGLIDEGRAALGKISEESAGIALTIGDWRANIATFTSAEEFNRAIPVIKKLPALLQAQVAKLLMDGAEAAKVPFDRDARLFVAPAVRETFL